MTVLQVYLHWANSLLNEINKKIEGIPDIQNGQVLCDLINLLTKTALIQEESQNDYIQKAIDHMKSNGIKPNFTVQDIIDGDIKSILDCLWQLILNYSVHNINHNIFRRTVGIGKRNLLDWCQKHLNTFFDGRNTLAKNLCADNWLVLLLEKFTDSSTKDEDKAQYISNLLNQIEVKYGIVKDILNPGGIIDGTVDEHALMIYVALLRRKTEGDILNTDSGIQHTLIENNNNNNNQTEKTTSNQLFEWPVQDKPVKDTSKMSETETTVRETISDNIKDYMSGRDSIDGHKPAYRREEEKAIILKRPTDYYNEWEKNIDRLSQGPETTSISHDTSTTPEDILLNIDDFNDSFDKSRSNTDHLYKPDYSSDDKHSDSQRSESRSPTRIVDRYQTRREYRHSPEPRSLNQTPDSGITSSSERKSRSNVRFHGRRDDRSPSPEAFSHFDELKHARKDVDKNMRSGEIKKRSRSDERDYKKNDEVSERTKALRLRASASLGRENRLRKQNEEMQAYNYNITDEMIKSNLGLKSDPVNVITPLRHIGSAERIYKDEDSTFVKLLEVQRNPPKPYELGAGRVPRREAWERLREYNPIDTELDLGGHREFLGSLDREIDKIGDSIEHLERSRSLPCFSTPENINDKLWSQEFRDISNIRNPFTTYNLYDDTRHLSIETTRSRSLSPRNRLSLPTYNRPKSSLGICQPNYRSNFNYEEVGLSEGKYRDEPLGRFDVRTNYYNPDYNQEPEPEPTYVSRATSVSPSRQSISLGYSSPVRRVHDEIWGSDLAEVDGLDPNRQEKWKYLINLTDMTNEDVIELKQALASAIVENDILYAKLTNAKKEFSEKLKKTNEVLDDCRKHLATAQAENQELRTFLNQEKRINAALEARIKELEEELNKTTTHCTSIEIKLEETIRELQCVREELEIQEDYEAENEKLQNRISTLERDNTALSEDLSRMQDTHEKSQATIHEIRKCLEEVRKERHELYDEVSRLKFKERYAPTVIEPTTHTYTERIVDNDVDVSTTPRPARTFKPIIESPQSSPVQSSTTSYSDRQTTTPDRFSHIRQDRQTPVLDRQDRSSARHTTSFDRQSTTTRQEAVPSWQRTSPIRQVPMPTRSTSPIRPSRHTTTSSRLHVPGTDNTSKFMSSRTERQTASTEPIINRSSYRSEQRSSDKSFTDYSMQDSASRTSINKSDESTSIPVKHTSRLSSPTRHYTHRTTSPLRTLSPNRSLSEGRNSRYSTLNMTQNFKPSTTTTHFTPRSTSPFKYHDVTVPSSYREIYPHRKSRYSSERSSLNASRDYERKSSSTTTTSNRFTDYPDLQQYPTRLRYSTDKPFTTPTRSSFRDDYMADHDESIEDGEEYEYKYVRKVTTITDDSTNKETYSEESRKPFTEHVSRRDRTFGEPSFGSRLRSRSQSPLLTRNDDNFRRDLDSVFDRHDSYRARSTSPARFPRRGILKHARSDQNLDERGKSSSPVRFTSYRDSSLSSQLSTSTSDNKTKVRIRPTPTNTYSSNNIVSSSSTSAVSPNNRYQIEMSAPPPLSDEQRSYANHLIDKYTKPSCSLRTVNI